MIDPLAVVRILNEFVAVLRRHNVAIAPTELIDAERALAILGLSERETVFVALKTTLIKHKQDEPIFTTLFYSFFDAHFVAPIHLWDRLRSLGFSDEIITTLHRVLMAQPDSYELQIALGVHGSAERTQGLRHSEITRFLEGLHTPLQIGFYTQRVLDKIGFQSAIHGFATLKLTLRALLDEQATPLISALEQELQHTRRDVRDFIAHELSRKSDQSLQPIRSFTNTPFAELSPNELNQVRQALRTLAEKLKGKIQIRRRHAQRGTLDLRRTLRKAWKTLGIPIQSVHKRRVRNRSKLIVLCDLSDSVRVVTQLFLECIDILHELLLETRSFVFVSELGEVTSLFRKKKFTAACAAIFSGEAISLTENSNYGSMLTAFYKQYLNQIDRRTTVVILGDARNNYQSDHAWVLADLRKRARAIVWLNPEHRSAWAIGDSVMNRYAPFCTRILQVSNTAELEASVRAMIAI